MIRDSEWTKERILEELPQRESEFALRFGVRRIGIFGSRARGDATATSDIDVLVEMDKPTFGAYMASSSCWKTCSPAVWIWCLPKA